MAANRRELVQRINEGFAENNLEKVLSFCNDDVIWTMVGDTTVRGKDSIREWMASMNPQQPKITIRQIVAEGDSVVTTGDMSMPDKKGGPPVPYTFCDVYRFAGERVAELTAFVIRIDKPRADNQTPNESRQTAGSRVN